MRPSIRPSTPCRAAICAARRSLCCVTAKGGITLKVSEKGAVSLYGMGRFPVTLYKEQWLRVLASAAEIEKFIRENESKLKTKD